MVPIDDPSTISIPSEVAIISDEPGIIKYFER
jgi:hypothetical protein